MLNEDMINEEYLKKQAQAQYGAAIGSTIGSTEPCRPTLRERVERGRWEASSASRREERREERLAELANLLDRNPEICRILDLIDMGIVHG